MSKKYHDDYIKWNQFKRYYKSSKRLRMKGNLRSPSRFSPRTRHHGALSSPSKARGWNTTPRRHGMYVHSRSSAPSLILDTGKVRENIQCGVSALESPTISFQKEQERNANEHNSTIPFEEMSFDDAISMVCHSQHGNPSFSGTRSVFLRKLRK